LFAPPDAFLGRTVTEILPPPLARMMMAALERAFISYATVVVEYELPMDEPRFYEARVVRVAADRLLSIVRDVTESKRASAINRDLVRRLISRQEDEWQQIARELHDDICQRLAVTVMKLESAAAQPAEALQALLRQLSAQISLIATDIHDLSYQLHPSRLRSLGLVSALDTLCEEASSRRGLQVAFSHGRLPARVDPAVSLCLFRIVQEALHNVAAHSGARSAQVSLLGFEGEIRLEITDSGVGFDPARVLHAGLGLVSMRERVAIVNGQLAIDSAPGGGTRVTVRIPFEPASPDQIT
jgi:signal transduction histidine kinase